MKPIVLLCVVASLAFSVTSYSMSTQKQFLFGSVNRSPVVPGARYSAINERYNREHDSDTKHPMRMRVESEYENSGRFGRNVSGRVPNGGKETDSCLKELYPQRSRVFITRRHILNHKQTLASHDHNRRGVKLLDGGVYSDIPYKRNDYVRHRREMEETEDVRDSYEEGSLVDRRDSITRQGKSGQTLGSLLTSLQRPQKTFNQEPETRSLKDGYWLLLQDWSQCSQKCGGGTSTQQWMCVPPKNGGKPCTGEAIRTKPCNSQPCPSINREAGKSLLTNTTGVVLKPIVGTLRMSQEQLNYLNCKVKQSTKENGALKGINLPALKFAG